MFYMKSDDIEELFREAAEKYQIDTEKAAAWDDVYEAVHGNGKPTPPTPPGNEHKKRWLNLLWLLLIPLGWFAHNVWNNVEKKATAKNEQAAVNKNIAAADEKRADGSAGVAKSNVGDKPAAAQPNNAVKGSADASAASAAGSPSAKQSAGKATPFNTGSTGIRTNNRMQIKTGGGDIKSGVTGNETNGPAIVTGEPALNSGIAKNGSDNNAALTPNTSAPANAGQGENGDKKGNDITAPAASVTTNNKPAAPAANDKKENKKDDKSKKPQEHFFYAGFMASPDISFVHGQKTSPAGVNAGLLAGYQVNKHFSVETGVLFDSKNYYTKGDYFDKNKIKYFAQNPEVYINSVDGDCKMIEIPLNIKYVFSAKNKNRWYAVAGLSSYLMGREYYAYDLSAWGTTYKTGLAYNNHVKNWFSIANLGLGYERSLGTKTNLRIEPFMKVPVSGVGTGNLSLTSTGLFIGLTRRIP